MYDLIGDIHGHADLLVCLLEQLGYDRRCGHYTHPTRRAIFLGDVIDRGPRIRETLAIIRGMVDHGGALFVLGNHELDAIGYHTRDSEASGEFIRRHTEDAVQQHVATLQQVPGEELYSYVDWLRGLPFWLDLDGLRAVHSSWDSAALQVIAAALETHGGITESFLRLAWSEESDLFAALDLVVRGLTPRARQAQRKQAKSVTGRGERRHPAVRGHGPPPPRLLLERIVRTDDGVGPLFVGHHRMQTSLPSLVAQGVACLDYRVNTSGMLCAYRWNGEAELDEDSFVVARQEL